MAHFATTVPVFLSVLTRMDGILDKIEDADNSGALLVARLHPDMFSAGEQLVICANYMLRVALPLAGAKVPNTEYEHSDVNDVRSALADVHARLMALDEADFDGAAERVISHRAGFADVTQNGSEFLHHYGMPNVMFHFAMAYAALRANGLNIGKSDFDGIHEYPDGFSWTT